MSRFALEGVHVLDFAWVGVGPITTKYLADNGADVIRVESAARLDVLRIAPPWKDAMPGINNSQFFASYNTSKKGITLDLSKPKARELAKRWCRGPISSSRVSRPRRCATGDSTTRICARCGPT